MRKYEALWNQLKRAGKIQITVPRDTHATVIPMIQRESVNDTGFRFKCVEDDKSYRLGFTQIGDVLQISIDYQSTVPTSFVITPERLERKDNWRSKYISKDVRPEDRARWVPMPTDHKTDSEGNGDK